MSQSPKLLCSRCAAPGSGTTCASCGGALLKACPTCQTRNSLAKKFCDSCAADLSLDKQPASPDIPHTATRKIGKTPPPVVESGGLNLPKAGRSEQSYNPVPTPMDLARPKTDRPKTVPGSRPLMPSGLPYFFRSVSALLFLALLITGTILATLHLRALHTPERLVPQVAKHYLDAISVNDYATAYEMISNAMKARFSVDEFRKFQEGRPWSWKNLATVHIEPEAVVLQYDAITDGRAVREAVIFILEEGKWVHPYVWPLLKEAQDALDHADPDMAIIKSQEAVRIHPRDPVARAILCDAAYRRRFSERVVSECSTALSLAARYQLLLSNSRRFAVHAMLADTYRNRGAFPPALEHYTQILSIPNLSARDQCAILLARAETRATAGQRAEAAADMVSARAKCASPEDQRYIQNKQRELTQ